MTPEQKIPPKALDIKRFGRPEAEGERSAMKAKMVRCAVPLDRGWRLQLSGDKNLGQLRPCFDKKIIRAKCETQSNF